MKKCFLRCLAVVMMGIVFSCVVAQTASAAGRTGFLKGSNGLKYVDLVMKPVHGEGIEEGSYVTYACSGKITPVGFAGDLAAFVFQTGETVFTTRRVELVLYKCEKDNSRKYLLTLFTKTYDDVGTAKFDEVGTISPLEVGTYCLQLKTEDYIVEENTFYVYEKATVTTAPPEKKNGYISVEHINENGTVVMNDTKILAPGTHTLYNEYNMPGYEKVGDLSQTVTVYNDGTASQSKVRFYVKWIEQTTDKVVNPVTAAPVTAAPITPAPVTKPAFPIINETCYIPDDGNNVRSGAGTNYSVLGQVNSGDWFVIYDYELGSTGKDWYKIYFNGQFGWISSGIVELNGNDEGTINGVPIGGNTSKVVLTPVPEDTELQDLTFWGLTNQRLSTRSGPGTNYAETGSYNNLANEWVEIRSRAWDNRNDIWWVEVEINGRWLWTGYKRFDSSTIPLEDIPINPYY